MKYYSVLIVQLWILRGTFCNDVDVENHNNSSQYWRTRNLSGSDYGIEYNLNHAKNNPKDETRAISFRTLFDWNANSNSKNVNKNQFIQYDKKMMPGDANVEQNRSNIWWPWSNYEEWTLARARDFGVNELSMIQSTNSLDQFVQRSNEKKKKRRRKKKRKSRKNNQKNKQPALETTTNQNAKSENRFLNVNSDIQMTRNSASKAPFGMKAPVPEHQFFTSFDNNQMDNEIHPRYNYYDSVPAVDSTDSFVDRIKKSQYFDYIFKGYSLRNFTDDINECLIDNGGCEGLCLNTPGSYKCHCPSGFRADVNKCLDVNECLLRNGHGPCQSKCTNVWGSYKCSCEDIPGTRLGIDGHTCEDIDECKEQTAGCSHECINTVGSAFCLCPKGFMLGLDWKTCHDIDECAMVDLQEIACQQRCENTIGSYICVN